MPKLVDHGQRRELIADAVCRLATRQGLEEVSLRTVAAEAGISVGQIQHYFGTKDDMLLFTFHTLGARVERRLGSATAARAGPPTTRSVLRTLLLAMVPTDSDNRFEAPLWVAFIARAVVKPELATPLRDGLRDLVGFAADQLRTAREAGEIAGSLDPDLEAAALFALADGMMRRALLDPELAATAVATLDYHLDRIFGSGQRSCAAREAQ